MLHHDVESVEGIKDYELTDISELADLAGGQAVGTVSTAFFVPWAVRRASWAIMWMMSKGGA
jgi:hypothetical protein